MGANRSEAHLMILGAISSTPITLCTHIFFISSSISKISMYFRYIVDVFSLPRKSVNFESVFSKFSASAFATLVKWLLSVLAMTFGQTDTEWLDKLPISTFSGHVFFFFFFPNALFITSHVERLSSLQIIFAKKTPVFEQKR